MVLFYYAYKTLLILFSISIYFLLHKNHIKNSEFNFQASSIKIENSMNFLLQKYNEYSYFLSICQNVIINCSYFFLLIIY